MEKKTKHCTHLHANSPQELKQRLGPVSWVLFVLLESVAFVHQWLDLAEFERDYSIAAFDHPLPDSKAYLGEGEIIVVYFVQVNVIVLIILNSTWTLTILTNIIIFLIIYHNCVSYQNIILDSEHTFER